MARRRNGRARRASRRRRAAVAVRAAVGGGDRDGAHEPVARAAAGRLVRGRHAASKWSWPPPPLVAAPTGVEDAGAHPTRDQGRAAAGQRRRRARPGPPDRRRRTPRSTPSSTAWPACGASPKPPFRSWGPPAARRALARPRPAVASSQAARSKAYTALGEKAGRGAASGLCFDLMTSSVLSVNPAPRARRGARRGCSTRRRASSPASASTRPASTKSPTPRAFPRAPSTCTGRAKTPVRSHPDPRRAARCSTTSATASTPIQPAAPWPPSTATASWRWATARSCWPC